MSILKILNEKNLEKAVSKLVIGVIEDSRYGNNREVTEAVQAELNKIIIPMLPRFIEDNKDEIIWKILGAKT